MTTKRSATQKVAALRPAILVAALIAIAATPLAACNTIEGFGEDIQSLGRAMKGEKKKTGTE